MNLPRTAILGVVSSVCTTIVVAVLAVWDGRPLAPVGHDSLGSVQLWVWIMTQALCLMSVPLATLCLYAAYTNSTKRVGLFAAVLNAVFIAFPLVVLLDSLVFPLIGERLFSTEFLNGVAQLIRLAPYITAGSFALATGAAVFGAGIGLSAWMLSTWLSNLGHRRMRILMVMVGLMYALAMACGTFYWLDSNADLTKKMEFRTAAHPFYVFGVLRSTRVGAKPKVQAQESSHGLTPLTGDASSKQQSSASFLARERRLRFAQPVPARKLDPLPDVVVVVIESLRPELVTRAVMPNVSRLAEEGLHCRYHFSGGNATNHGVFCLVTGLEPIWFGTSQRFEPRMLRWFKSLGYKTGFFAGANDWDEFQMSGFIRPQLFDQYEAKPRDGIASDRRAIELASAFLSRPDDSSGSQVVSEPRLALVYLYGTHATYQSYASDQLDQPAADNRFPFPYPARMRDSVWNRYRNSARTIDRLLKPLLRRDRVVVTVGDHGEAFLEDGTVGHGTRLSRAQNMTAAVLYCPGKEGQVLEQPTCHADVLPTLLSFLQVDVSDPRAIDGISLTNATEEQLRARRFSVRNYLSQEYGLIGPWTKNSAKPFAYRFGASIRAEAVSPLNGIDEFGLESESQNIEEQTAEVTKWMSHFYRRGSGTPGKAE